MSGCVRWSAQQLADAQRRMGGTNPPVSKADSHATSRGPVRGNKYRAKRTEYAGTIYDSAKEARRAAELDLLVRAGAITDLRRQVRFSLDVDGVHIATYVADFAYQDGGVLVVEDVKSSITRTLPVYRMKKRLMAAIHKIEIVEVI